MKKEILFALSLLLLACGSSDAWDDAERENVKNAIAEQRERFALQYMGDAEFSSLQECAVQTLVEIFPEYAMYDSLPDRDATLDGIVTDCISDLTGEDFENLHKLLPYARLASAGLVPEAGSPGNFYDCLSGKLRNTYPNSDVFVMALLVDSVAPRNLREIIRQCGSGE